MVVVPPYCSINSTISFIEGNGDGNAAAALVAGLAVKTNVSDSPKSDHRLRELLHTLKGNVESIVKLKG